MYSELEPTNEVRHEQGELPSMPKPLEGEDKLVTLLAMIKRWVNSQKNFNEFQMEKMMEELEEENSLEARLEIVMGRFESILDNYKTQVKAGKSMLTRAGLIRGVDHRAFKRSGNTLRDKVDRAAENLKKQESV